MNLSKMCCCFNHHFWLLTNLISILWCIFARVFPSKSHTIICFQGSHSPHPQCVRTSHAPSLVCCNNHTLSTNRDILLASVWNRGQGITVRPTAGTPTPNGLRSNWDFLSGSSPYMLVGPTPSTPVEQNICKQMHIYVAINWYRGVYNNR